MKRYALLGRDIQHSLSPAIYKELIKVKHVYDLIDVKFEDKLQDLEGLRLKYDGINITSPYKEHYFNKDFAISMPPGLRAVNCISFSGENIQMTNTDYIAAKKILNRDFIEKYSVDDFFVLGDGVMSKMFQLILNEQKLDYKVVHRKNISDINAYCFDRETKQNDHFSLVINCSARAFNFSAELDKQTLFWDMNYAMSHADSISRQCVYVDGYSLLYEQAKEAVKFWDKKTVN
jgi:shikimate dehydrogenase